MTLLIESGFSLSELSSLESLARFIMVSWDDSDVLCYLKSVVIKMLKELTHFTYKSHWVYSYMFKPVGVGFGIIPNQCAINFVSDQPGGKELHHSYDQIEH